MTMMPNVKNAAPRFVEEFTVRAGWLGPLYQPMRIDADATNPIIASATSACRSIRRNANRTSPDPPAPVDNQVAAGEGSTRGRLRLNQDRAFDLLATPQVKQAFDLSREDPHPRTLRDEHSRPSGAASAAPGEPRAGVTVFWPNDGLTNVSVYWDTHSRNFIDLKTRLCPVTDQAFSRCSTI